VRPGYFHDDSDVQPDPYIDAMAAEHVGEYGEDVPRPEFADSPEQRSGVSADRSGERSGTGPGYLSSTGAGWGDGT